jgi:hypothetical protein
MQARRCLQESDSDGTSGDEHLSGEGGEGSSTSVGKRLGGRSDSAVRRAGSTTSGGLDLAVGDLGDGLASRSLDLTVGDLSDRLSSRSLDLTVGDLSDGLASGGRGLDLAVRDLGDGLSGRGSSLDLTVGDLGDGLGSTSGGLDLTIRDLGNNLGGGGGLELTVTNLGGSTGRGNTASLEDVDVDGRALRTSGLVVEVVEVTAQALVEDSRGADGEGSVAADGETRGVDGTGLGGLVELELVVGGNVTSAALVIGQDTVGKSNSQDLLLTSLKGALGGSGDVSNGDAEGTIEAGLAALRSRLLGGNGLSDTLGEGGSDTSKGSSDSEGLHVDGDDVDDRLIG